MLSVPRRSLFFAYPLAALVSGVLIAAPARSADYKEAPAFSEQVTSRP
jgi:hypothetical protein